MKIVLNPRHLRAIITKNTIMRFIKISILILFLCSTVSAQEGNNHSFRFSGQVSAWGQYTPDIDKTLWLGGRYVPQINYAQHLSNSNRIDFEASANIFGDLGIKPFSEFDADGTIKPYRIWTRYSNRQMEFRAGLQ